MELPGCSFKTISSTAENAVEWKCSSLLRETVTAIPKIEIMAITVVAVRILIYYNFSQMQ